VESLTNRMEEEAFEIIQKIDDMGGMLAAIEQHYPQLEIADAAYRYQKQIDDREKTVVGVNKYAIEKEDIPVEVLEIDEELETLQIEKTNRVKESRDGQAVVRCLKRVGEACSGTENVMEHLINAVKAGATLQEVCDVFRDVFGSYRDPGIY
jgi:methylmalonyl-CoA mutase N-terminal domain/subunit